MTGQRGLHVAARVPELRLPDDPVGKRQLAVRPGAQPQIVAEHPVVQVVLRPVPRACPGRHFVVLVGTAQHLAHGIEHGCGQVIVGYLRRKARKQRVRLQRQVIAGQVRRRKRQRRGQILAQLGQRLLRQRIHQVEIEGVEQPGGSLGRRPRLRAVMHPAQRLQLGVRERLDAQRQPRHPGSPVIGKAGTFEGARIGLHRHFRVGQQRQPRPQAGQQPVDGRPGEQAGRAATNEHRHHPPPPDERQAGIQIGLQRVQIGVFIHAVGRRVVRVEVAVRALPDAPRNVHIHRQRRQVVELHAPSGMQANGKYRSRHVSPCAQNRPFRRPPAHQLRLRRAVPAAAPSPGGGG